MSAPKPRFEDTLNQLEQLLDTMESGELSLDESLAAFEEGVKLTRSAQQALANAQQKVEVLMASEEDDFDSDDHELLNDDPDPTDLNDDDIPF